MRTAIHIVHNKKLSMTAEEATAFENLCQSYDRPNFKGADLFQGLFETDKQGNITLIKAPTQQVSMEIFLFVLALYEQQGRRLMETRVEETLSDLTKKFETRMDELAIKYAANQ